MKKIKKILNKKNKSKIVWASVLYNYKSTL